MTLPCFLLSAVWCMLGPGTAENPPLTAPLEPGGAPQAFWWDAQALHVGTQTFAWAALRLTPTNGCTFALKLGGKTALREDVHLKGMLCATAARARIGGFGTVGSTSVTMRVEATPAAKGTVKSYLSASGATRNYVMVPQAKAVAAGETAAFDICTPQCSVSGRLNYRLTDVDGRNVYTYAGPYRDPNAAFDWQYVWTDVAALALVVETAGWCDDAGCTARLTAHDYTSDTMACWTKSVPVGKVWGQRALRFGVDDLPPGFYWMHLDYLDAAGRPFAADRRFPYLKPAAHMPWEGNRLGAEDTVPPPWTPPEFGADGTFRCWNRVVRLGGEGLVRSVTCGGKELLTRPVALVLDGRPLAFDVRLEAKRNSEATYALTARGADVAVRVTCEFDGFMRFEATFPASAKSLEWQVAADRRHVTGFDDCSREDNARAYFPKGTDPAFDFNPAQWQMWWMPGPIGMMGGVLNLHGWHVRHAEKAGRVVSTAREIAATTVFVDEPMPAGPRRTVAFYLEPTPVKPKNMQLASTDEKKLKLWTGHVTQFFEAKYPGFLDQKACQPFRDALKKGQRVFFYNGSSGYAYADAFWNWYRREWHRSGYTTFAHEAPSYDPKKRDTGWTYACLNSKSFFDYKIWGVNWFLNDAIPEMKDLYFDLANPGPCQNADHGCAWKDDFGRQMRDWAVLPTRELHKRAYRLVKRKNPDGALYGHIGSRRGPSDVFFDMICAGEGFAYRIHQHDYNYYDIFSPEVMQSFFMPRGQELVMNVLAQFGRARSCWAPHLLKDYGRGNPEHLRAIRHFVAYVKIHDLLVSNSGDLGTCGVRVDEPSRRIRAHGTHHAYWQEGADAVTLSAPGPRQLWSWLTDGKEGILIVLNDTDAAVEQTVAVKGLSAKGKELVDGAAFDFTSGACTLKLGPREARFIHFKMK